VLTQADINAGQVLNLATTTGTTPNGTPVSDNSDDPQNPENVDPNLDGNPDDPTVTLLPQDPSIEVEKTGTFNDANGDGYAQVGETISYTFKVTNTGNVTLTNVTISDPLVSISGGPIAVFAPGAVNTTTFTGLHVITQADINAGQFINIATATGTDPHGVPTSDQSDDPQNPTNVDPDNDGDPDDPTVTLMPQDPNISITKKGTWNDLNGNGYADAGETITYTFVVTNTGNVTLTNITVTDPLVTVVGGPLTVLAPGLINSSTFSRSYVLTQADINSGKIVIVATATGTDPNGDPMTDVSDDPQNPTNVDPNNDGDPDDPTVTLLPLNPDISITKTGVWNDSNNDGNADAGETISYTFKVTNTGNVTLTNLTVTDP